MCKASCSMSHHWPTLRLKKCRIRVYDVWDMVWGIKKHCARIGWQPSHDKSRHWHWQQFCGNFMYTHLSVSLSGSNTRTRAFVFDVGIHEMIDTNRLWQACGDVLQTNSHTMELLRLWNNPSAHIMQVLSLQLHYLAWVVRQVCCSWVDPNNSMPPPHLNLACRTLWRDIHRCVLSKSGQRTRNGWR